MASLSRAIRWATLAAVALAAAGLVACRGGGGSGPSPAPGNPGGDSALVLTGRLWHDDYALDALDGFHVSPLDGTRTRRVDALADAAPMSDGVHYVSMEYDLRHDTSRVSIKSSADVAVVHQAVFDGYVKNVRPSPTRWGELLLLWASSATAGDGVVTAVDLPARQTLRRWPGRAAADWLPDGRVISADEAGTVFVETIGQPETAHGRMTVPGWKLRALWVAPTGDRMITRWVRLDASGELAETDLWISGIDSSAFERLTSAGWTSFAVWSPDGQAFAFDQDRANACTGTTCTGASHCELHVAPVAARQIALGDSRIRLLTVTSAAGSHRTLGCDLSGWTR